MNIHNLQPQEIALLDALWSKSTLVEVDSFISALDEPQARAARYLIGVMTTGGDDVQDLSQARLLLDRISKM